MRCIWYEEKASDCGIAYDAVVMFGQMGGNDCVSPCSLFLRIDLSQRHAQRALGELWIRTRFERHA